MSKLSFFRAITVSHLTAPVTVAMIENAFDAVRVAGEDEAHLADADGFIHEAQGLYYRTPTPHQASSFGFADPLRVFALDSDGSWMLHFKYAERKISKPALTQATAKRVSEIEHEENRELNKDECTQIRDAILSKMLSVAPVVETPVKLFYQGVTQYLVCDTPKLSGAAFSMLAKLIGSLSTETVHVPEIKNTLAQNLLKALKADGDLAIGRFGYGSKLYLKSADSERKANYTEDYYHDHVRELLEEDFKVMLVRLESRGMAFDLTHDFKIKGITFNNGLEFAAFISDGSPDAEADRLEYELSVASMQLNQISDLVKDLVEVVNREAQALREAAKK